MSYSTLFATQSLLHYPESVNWVNIPTSMTVQDIYHNSVITQVRVTPQAPNSALVGTK